MTTVLTGNKKPASQIWSQGGTYEDGIFIKGLDVK